MLYEGDVIGAVCAYLETQGYTIKQKLLVSQAGVDIVAENGSRDPAVLHVEAKGATSSIRRSPQYGNEFDSSQIKTHVGVAVLAALGSHSLGNARSAVAFPDNPGHRKVVDRIQPALSAAGIAVFWVNDSRLVTLDSPWEL